MLLISASLIVFWAGWNIVMNFSIQKSWITEILHSIGALVVSLAIVDIANYMFEEEIFKNNELSSPAEARKTLTKIFVIIIIAICLEALVYVFKAGEEHLTLLLYPSILVLVSGIIMLLLGVYQKISIQAEKLSNLKINDTE